MWGLLPGHGRNIYREAFNDAREQYVDPPESRNPGDSREEVAGMVLPPAPQWYKENAGFDRAAEFSGEE